MKKLILMVFNIAISVIVITVSIFAWYTNTFGIKADTGVMSSKNIYFESGNGTASNPYIISQPRHLYNLAWLQDLGYFDSNVDSNKKTEEIDQFYFQLKNDIDMSNFGSALPPIGIENHPFIGDFEGGGYKISNLVIDVNFNNDKYLKPTDQVLNISNNTINNGVIISNAVGLFGVIKSGNALKINNSALSVRNFLVENLEIKNSLKSYTGLLSGLVDGNLSNVAVMSGRISLESGIDSLLNNNLSEYTLIGNTTDTTGWGDRPGKVEDYVFDSALIYDIIKNQNGLSGGVDFNASYPNHTAYNKNIFNMIGELKLYEKKGFICEGDFLSYNDGVTYSYHENPKSLKVQYSYENKSYTYEEDFTGYAIQFQDGLNKGIPRNDRCIKFHADGKGAIFLAYSGNAAGKQISLYKNDNTKVFPKDNDTSSAVSSKNRLKWVRIDIEKSGDYKFLVEGGNTYLTHIHFIMSNNQGNSGGDVSSASISKIGWVSSDVERNDDLSSVIFNNLTVIILVLTKGTINTGSVYFEAKMVDGVTMVFYKKNGYDGIISGLPADKITDSS